MRQAFEDGRAQVAADDRMERVEHNKFLLLPEDAAHDETIFGDALEGELVDETPRLPRRHNLPSLPAFFCGRHEEISNTMFQIRRNKIRCVAVTGKGIHAVQYCRRVTITNMSLILRG